MSFWYSWFDRDQVGGALGDEYCEPLCEALFAESDEDMDASKDDSTQSLMESSVSTSSLEQQGVGKATFLAASSPPGSNTTTSSFKKTKRKTKVGPKRRKRKEKSYVPYDEDSLSCRSFTLLQTSCTREDDSVPSDEGRRDVELAARADKNKHQGVAIPSRHADKTHTEKKLSEEKIVHINSWSDQSSIGSGGSSPAVKRRMRNAFKKLRAAMKEQRSISPILHELSHLEELFLAESDGDSRKEKASSNDSNGREPTARPVKTSSLNPGVSGKGFDPAPHAPPPPPPPPKKKMNLSQHRTPENIQKSLVKSLHKARAEKMNATAQHMMLNIDLAFARNRWKAAAVIQRIVRGYLVRLSVKQAMKHLIQDTAALVIQDAWLAFAARNLQQNTARPFRNRRRESACNWQSTCHDFVISSEPTEDPPTRHVGGVGKYKRRFQCQQREITTLSQIQEETKSILSCDTDSINDYDPELIARIPSSHDTSSMGRKGLRALVSPPCVHWHSEFPDPALLFTPFEDGETSVEREHAAAIDIQRMNRGLMCRILYRKITSAIILQVFVRQFIARKQLRMAQFAAVRIQKGFRLYSAKMAAKSVAMESSKATRSKSSLPVDSDTHTSTSTGASKKQKRRRRKTKKSKR